LNEDSPLDEESIIKLLWGRFGKNSANDPFDDDAAWVLNSNKKFVVGKADMLVATTDAPVQMTPSQIARKSIVACVSDLAAKGVKPEYCLISLGLPRELATRKYVIDLARGFASAESEYRLRIIGGDTNATSRDPVIDCSIFGFANSLVLRRGAKPGDLIGVSGKFGIQQAGLLLLLNKAKSSDQSFSKAAIDSVLEPNARLDLGLRVSRYLSSCIDSSDGLAISLYHLAESSKVSFDLHDLPIHSGVSNFAKENGLVDSELVLFGGEEYELVCTYSSDHESDLKKLGVNTIGTVKESRNRRYQVRLNGRLVTRRGWLHFKSDD